MNERPWPRRHRRYPGPGIAACLALALCSGACGYRMVGSNPQLPENIKVIAVTAFENRTQRPEIEQRVTEQVSSELSRRGRYKVVTTTSGADAVIEGAISSYRTTPVVLDSQGRATRMEAIITLQATLRDLATDELVWSQSGLVFRQQFDVVVTEDFFNQEDLALIEIAVGAADMLVSSIFEGF